MYTSHHARPSADLFRQDADALAAHPLLSGLSPERSLVIIHQHDGQVPRLCTDAYINALHLQSYIAPEFTHVFDADAPADVRAQYQQQISGLLNDE